MTVRTYVCAMATLACGTALPLAAQQPTGDTTQATAPDSTRAASPDGNTQGVPPNNNAAGARQPGGVSLDFDAADLRVVIGAIARVGGIDYTDNDLPTKKISLHVRLQPGRRNAMALLKRVVAANNLYMVDREGVILISSVPSLSENARNSFAVADTQLFFYRLKHSNATALAGVLQAVFNGGAVPTTGAGITRPTLSQANRQSFGGSGGFGGGGMGGGGLGGGGGGGLGSGGFAQGFGQTGVNSQPGARGPGGRSQGPITIVPEVSTNSLLIRTDSATWSVVKKAIDEVDIRPLQVMIEVMIVEVQRNESMNLGFGVNGSNQRTFNGRTLGSANLPSDTSSANFIANLTRYGAVDVKVAISALSTRGNVHVLSRPIVFAQNNVESRLLVGSQQPFIQSSVSQPTLSTAQNNVVQYRDVGTSLDIIPTINPDGYVNLQVQQQVSAVTNQIQFGAPVITTREASASVFVKDGQTVVVGGLTDSQEEKDRKGIPFLSNIPLIGGLFGSTQNVSSRTELYLFLTPHVVKDDDDVRSLEEAVRKKASTLMHDLPPSQYFIPAGSRADSTTSPVQAIPLPKR